MWLWASILNCKAIKENSHQICSSPVNHLKFIEPLPLPSLQISTDSLVLKRRYPELLALPPKKQHEWAMLSTKMQVHTTLLLSTSSEAVGLWPVLRRTIWWLSTIIPLSRSFYGKAKRKEIKVIQFQRHCGFSCKGYSASTALRSMTSLLTNSTAHGCCSYPSRRCFPFHLGHQKVGLQTTVSTWC